MEPPMPSKIAPLPLLLVQIWLNGVAAVLYGALPNRAMLPVALVAQLPAPPRSLAFADQNRSLVERVVYLSCTLPFNTFNEKYPMLLVGLTNVVNLVLPGLLPPASLTIVQ